MSSIDPGDGYNAVIHRLAVAATCSVADCSHRAIVTHDGTLYCGTHGYVVRVAAMTAASDSPTSTAPVPTWEAVTR